MSKYISQYTIDQQRGPETCDQCGADTPEDQLICWTHHPRRPSIHLCEACHDIRTDALNEGSMENQNYIFRDDRG